MESATSGTESETFAAECETLGWREKFFRSLAEVLEAAHGEQERTLPFEE